MEKIRVLMIDDNVNLTEMVKEYFKGHKKIEVVGCCYDGEEGLNYILENGDTYDIILLDLIMPKRDGIYVLEELKKKNNVKVEKVVAYFWCNRCNKVGNQCQWMYSYTR